MPPLNSSVGNGPRAIIAALIDSVRTGPAGFAARLGLSFACAAGGVGVLMLGLGAAQYFVGRVREEHAALGMMVVLLLWLGMLYPIWGSYSRKRHMVKTIILCVAVVVCTVGAAVLVGVTIRRPEFFVVGTAFLGAAVLVGIVTAAAHAGGRGRAMMTGGGAVSVLCPTCGYSMSGLETSVCPECGAKYTIDELIRAQDYESLRMRKRELTSGERPALPALGEQELGSA